jgi:uncharacterized protein (DUF4415 family)
MAKNGDIKRYTADQLAAMRRKGESRTNWAKVDATTEEELEASIGADPDDSLDTDWSQITIGMPPRKQDIHIRIDADVLGWFKGTGKGYQTRMNNVLRAFVASPKGPTAMIPRSPLS